MSNSCLLNEAPFLSSLPSKYSEPRAPGCDWAVSAGSLQAAGFYYLEQSKNVEEIARLGGALYDKFVGFLEDLESIGGAISKSEQFYDSAMNKLSEGKGNLISRTEKIKELGAKTKKSIPQNLLSKEK